MFIKTSKPVYSLIVLKNNKHKVPEALKRNESGELAREKCVWSTVHDTQGCCLNTLEQTLDRTERNSRAAVSLLITVTGTVLSTVVVIVVYSQFTHRFSPIERVNNRFSPRSIRSVYTVQ